MPTPPLAERVTLVMTTRDRRERAVATVGECRELPGRPPIVVVDDASQDGTTAALRGQFPDVEVLRRDRSAGAAARNDAVRHATTPYIAFVDDDSGWAPGSLDRAAEIFDAHPEVALIAARMLVGAEEREDPINALMADSPLRDPSLPGPEVLGFLACGAVVRRDAFLAVGGFEPRYHLGGEEELLALDLRRQGWRSVYLEDVIAYHAPDAADPRPDRRRRQARNELWTAWLRRRPAGALRATTRTARGAFGDQAVRQGLVDAVRGLPWIRRERTPLPIELERDRRRLDRSS
jgi:GT2 family glycosyltransferase